jgi:hypothetical protein
MSVPFDPSTGAVGTPKLLFRGPYSAGPMGFQTYDVTPDGRRFLLVKTASEAAPREVRVVRNWFEELRARTRR